MRRTLKRVFLFIGIFLLLFILLYLLFFSQIFKIKNLLVLPPNKVLQEDIGDYLRKRWNINFLIFNSKLKDYLTKKYPQYKKIEIHKSFNTLNIFLYKREDKYCIKLNENWYFIDENGVITDMKAKCSQPIVEIINTKDTPKLWKKMPDFWVLERYKIYNSQVKKYKNRIENILKNKNYLFEFKEIFYDKKDPMNLILFIKNTQNTRFKILLDINQRELPIKNLIYFFESGKFDINNYPKIEYFDLRIKNRVIYKLKF